MPIRPAACTSGGGGGRGDVEVLDRYLSASVRQGRRGGTSTGRFGREQSDVPNI